MDPHPHDPHHNPFGHHRVPVPVDVAGAAAFAFQGIPAVPALPPPAGLQPQPLQLQQQQPPQPLVHLHDPGQFDPNGQENRETIDAPEILSKRQKAARGTLAKIDSVYSSVHALELVGDLLKDACCYLETVGEEYESKKRRQRKDREKREKEERKRAAKEMGKRRKSPGRKAKGKVKAGSPTKILTLDEIKRQDAEKSTDAIRGQGGTSTKQQRKKGKKGDQGQAKLDEIMGGFQAAGAEQQEADLEDAVMDWKKVLQHGVDAIRMAISGLDQHSSIISQAIANSTDNKEVRYAQRKLMKNETGKNAQRLISEKMMERNPEAALSASMKYAEETLGAMLAKTNPDFLAEASKTSKAKKRKKVPVEDSVAAAGGAAEEDEGAAKRQKTDVEWDKRLDEEADVDVIDLPEPMEGKKMYSPLETVSYVQHMIDNNPGREYLRAYKEKIMRQKLVPIQKSQLNSMVRMYGGPDKPVAPVNWANRGAGEVGWKSLLQKFHEKQSKGMSWSIDDTRDSLNAAAVEKNKALPAVPLIETHHRTLIELHKLQNHIGRQVEAQEERLKQNPPRVPHKPQQGRSLPMKKIRFDKNDEKYDRLVLPEPAGGELMYTPQETIDNVTNFVNGDPRPSRVEVRAFKEKMIAERVVPVSISQLNCLLRKCTGPDGQPPPRHWNLKGREEIMNIDDLVKQVQASQIMWTFEDTRAAVWASKRQKYPPKDGLDVKCPDKKTINGYHTALMSIPELAGRVVKPVMQKPGPKSNQM